MHFYSTPLRNLRILLYRMRLGVLSLCYLTCVIVFTVSFFYSHDASLFALPVALAAWLFRRREISIFVGIVILTGIAKILETCNLDRKVISAF